jgi:hypothetical protein
VSDRDRLRGIQRWTLLLGAVLTLSAFLLGGSQWGFSVSMGAAIMILNTFATRLVGDKLWQGLRSVAPANGSQTMRVVILFNLKMAAVIVAVYLVVRYLHVHAVGLVLGLSIYPLGAVLSTLLDPDGSMLSGPPNGNGSPAEDQHG